MLALHLLAQRKKAGRNGVVFLSGTESRAEHLGAVINALDSACDVLVYPRLDTLPFDQLEPSRDTAGRRSSVLRRLVKPKKPVLLITTPEAIMERLPVPASWSRIGVALKVGNAYVEADLKPRLEALGYDLDTSADYPGGVLFHGNTFEIFPAGGPGPFRIGHSGGKIRQIAAFNPTDQEVICESRDLLVDPMSERLALGGGVHKRSSLFNYCAQAKWTADAAVPSRADAWLSMIEEAAVHAEREREYVSRRDWGQAMKRIGVLPPTTLYRGTPDFSKLARPRKALRDYVGEAQRYAPGQRRRVNRGAKPRF